jgi:hypothetical protein
MKFIGRFTESRRDRCQEESGETRGRETRSFTRDLLRTDPAGECEDILVKVGGLGEGQVTGQRHQGHQRHQRQEQREQKQRTLIDRVIGLRPRLRHRPTGPHPPHGPRPSSGRDVNHRGPRARRLRVLSRKVGLSLPRPTHSAVADKKRRSKVGPGNNPRRVLGRLPSAILCVSGDSVEFPLTAHVCLRPLWPRAVLR